MTQKSYDIIIKRELKVTQSRKVRVKAETELEAYDKAEKRVGINEGAKQPVRYKRKWKTDEVSVETVETGLVNGPTENFIQADMD